MEKPYKDSKEVTTIMILRHPYFETLNEEELHNVISYMNFEYYQRIPGYSREKTNYLYNKIHNMKKEQTITGYSVIKKDTSSSKLTSALRVGAVVNQDCKGWKGHAYYLGFSELFSPIYKEEEEKIELAGYPLTFEGVREEKLACFGCKKFGRVELHIIKNLLSIEETDVNLCIGGELITPDFITKILSKF